MLFLCSEMLQMNKGIIPLPTWNGLYELIANLTIAIIQAIYGVLKFHQYEISHSEILSEMVEDSSNASTDSVATRRNMINHNNNSAMISIIQIAYINNIM